MATRLARRVSYKTPAIVDFGDISSHTFTTPGGATKGCTVNCKLDKFSEQSKTEVILSP
jgi:hypothetical protein